MKKVIGNESIILLLGLISFNLLNIFCPVHGGCSCSSGVKISGVSIIGEITQGNHVTLQVSILNSKSPDELNYELKLPAGIPELQFNVSTIPFNITGYSMRVLFVDLLINTAVGDFELVFLLDKGGCLCSYSIYHLIVARERFLPGLYNITIYNEILVKIELENNIINNVYLNISRIDHVFKVMGAGILVSIGMWGIFNAHPIWIVEDRERRLHHHFKRGLAFVSAAVSEVLFSSYLFAIILPPVLLGVPYGNEIYGLLCAGTALFTILGIDRMKYRIIASMFLFITLLMSSFVIALISLFVIITSTCIFLLQRFAHSNVPGDLQEKPVQRFSRLIRALKKGDNKNVYEL